MTDFYEYSRQLLKKGGFNLRSWSSYCPEVMERAERDGVAEKSVKVKVLGLRWDSENDNLRLLPVTFSSIHQDSLTKRMILSDSSKVYDPIGFISPLLINAKALLQDIWRRSLVWDDPVPKDIKDRWVKISKETSQALDFDYGRMTFDYGLDSIDGCELHVFADASEKAYGAVAYLVRDTDSRLLMSKSRVAPVKQLSIPQLELVAGVIASRLAKFILDAIGTPKKLFAWSDYQSVLYRLQSDNPLKSFELNRITEIKSQVPDAVWGYCPSSENPADVLTRGCTASELRCNRLWWEGPEWLRTGDHPKWSAESTLLNVQLPILEEVGKNIEPEKIGIDQIIDARDYSDLNRLFRISAWVMRFVDVVRGDQKNREENLRSSEIERARIEWIKASQRDEFAAAREMMRGRSQIKVDIVHQLNLYIDDDDVIRCHGRIGNSDLPFSTKFPVLLPKTHRLAQLVVRDAHEGVFHLGINSTVTFIRQSFWISCVRQLVKSMVRQCVACRKLSGRPFKLPVEPPLPGARVADVPAFFHTGIDFAGPFNVKMMSESQKCYVCLFTCSVSRGLHLEVTEDQSTESFTRAFRRFVSRRSLPKKVLTDNAATFKKASEYVSKKGVAWSFITKRAPWHGGFWERLVGIVKMVLKKVIGRAHISFDDFRTVVSEAEAIVNDRPLTYSSTDINDEAPVTPSQLMCGHRLTTLPHDFITPEELEDPDFQIQKNEADVRPRRYINAIS
ncbi:uncharacterized protein LOC141910296 [Tubulanus polymorphus]|uniref:uncharacterized protein LOC141910296 n=1 Tax=Tubulanus polymorphus TaxID=672921 RepID=UPI003DA5E18E